jgi:hypothetical protein
VWLGGALALLVFLPNLLLEIQNGWPTISLLHVVVSTKYSSVTPWEFAWQQSLLMHSLATPVWFAGLLYLLFDSSGRRYAALGWTYLVVLAELVALHEKIYYLAPAYPMLLAAGAVWMESRMLPQTGRWLQPAINASLVVGGLIAAP